jgi:acetate kinase
LTAPTGVELRAVDELALVLNAGSSSLKFSVFVPSARADWEVAARGELAGIGAAARLSVRDGSGAALATAAPAAPAAGVHDARGALEQVLDWLRTTYRGARLLAVGHRVVHGGQRSGPAIVTPALLKELRELAPLAPLHQPHDLAAIDAVAQRQPEVPQVACFDTSFHHHQPGVAKLVPLPQELRRGGIERYGFHGLSYEYIASVLPQVAPAIARERVIIAHLGSGASLCALRGGQSVDCTMGFTALDGLCMATRPGALDPGVVLYLFQELGMSVHDVEDLLYRKAGLAGISGISGDMRQLLESREPTAQLAVEYFVYRAAKEIGAMTAALGGLDGLVFTAGIGENSPEIRGRICAASAWLGIELDQRANSAPAPCISAAASAVSAWMIPTNEELVIARHTGRLLGLPGKAA